MRDKIIRRYLLKFMDNSNIKCELSIVIKKYTLVRILKMENFKKKILIIGQGGREHALVKALKKSQNVSEIHCIPGSAGISEDAFCHLDISYNAKESILNFCLNEKIDFVLIGPEDPLVFGLSDFLRDHDILVVGPSQAAANLEGSKVFSKEFMNEFGVATSKYKLVTNVKEAMLAMSEFTPPYVLKADGLCAGKGVYICKNESTLKEAAELFFEKKIFGKAGERAVLEQFLPGYELSVLVLTNGSEYEVLPLAQDHKQLQDGDNGPNTGGMGTIAPLKIESKLMSEIKSKIIEPTIKGFQNKKFIYRGVVFFGIMVTAQGPMCLEYNVRFGDPETQVILPLLDGQWSDVFLNLSKGELIKMNWNSKLSACCVVLAAAGYPDQPVRGDIISFNNDEPMNSNSYILHAGTKKNEKSQWITNGGRVLNIVGIGESLNSARELAYEKAYFISWDGLQKRNDIGLRKNLTT